MIDLVQVLTSLERVAFNECVNFQKWYHYPVIAFLLPGGFPIYTFSLLLAGASALGLAWVLRQAPHTTTGLVPGRAGLWALAGALLGARLLYVLSRPAYFGAHPLHALQVNQGGLSASGALLGGVLVLLLYARLARQPIGQLADALLPLVACVAVGAWLGCWLDGVAYGSPATAWWALPARDEWGAIQLRLPLQLAGAAFSLGIFALLDGNWRLGARLQGAYPGVAGCLALLGLALVQLGVSFLRADPMPSWNGLRLDTWGALATLGLSFVFLVSLRLHGRYHSPVIKKSTTPSPR